MSWPGFEIGDDAEGRGAQTRRAIAAAAWELLLERGYDGMTMRAVAQRAGVSVGNAYYYFPSKGHLVQDFYQGLQVEHAAAATVAMAGRTDLTDRLRTAYLSWLDVGAPHHALAARMLGVALEPGHPSSPFSVESGPARARSIALFAEVLDGSSTRVPPALRAVLPQLLWLGQLGIVLYWLSDDSPDQARTRALVEGVVPPVARLVRLARLPGMSRVVDELADLVRRFGPAA